MRSQQEEITRLRRWKKWVIDLFSNQSHSLAHKATAFAIELVFEKHPTQIKDDKIMPYLPELKEIVGIGEQTLSDGMKALEQSGMIERHVVQLDPTKRRIEVKRNGLWKTPKQAYIEPRNHGGDRRCPNCGSMHLRKMPDKYACEDCGIVSTERKGKLYA